MSRRSSKSQWSENDILDLFMQDHVRKKQYGNYRIEGKRLIYQSQRSEDAHRWNDASEFLKAKTDIGKVIQETDGFLVNEQGQTVLLESLTANDTNQGFKIRWYEQNIIAEKATNPDGNRVFIGNSSILPLVGRTMAYGNERLNTRETEIQQIMASRGFTMLPLHSFDAPSLEGFEIIERIPATTHEIEGKHFDYRTNQYNKQTIVYGSGMLFKLNNKYYLQDIDRGEVNKLNHFVTELPRSATSVADAYAALKPFQVVDAESKGLNVTRIGPVFFIPCNPPHLPVLTTEEKLLVLMATAKLNNTQKSFLFKADYEEQQITALLEKVPTTVSVEGKIVETGIKLDGVLYVTDEINAPNNISRHLTSWHTVVIGQKSLLKGA